MFHSITLNQRETQLSPGSLTHPPHVNDGKMNLISKVIEVAFCTTRPFLIIQLQAKITGMPSVPTAESGSATGSLDLLGLVLSCQ